MNITKCVNIPSFMLAMFIYKKGHKTPTHVYKMLGITYSAVLDINNSLIEIGWITKKPINKKSYEIVLTEKGLGIADSITMLFEKIGIVLKGDEEEKE